MTSPLYRPEALQARQDDWMGSVRLPATRMARMMAWVAMAAIAALVLVLALGSHVRKLPARGQVVPVGGVLQVLAPASGSVTASFAGEGDSVKAGQPLLQLQSTLAGTAADGRLATRLDAEFKAQLRDIDTELAGIAQERATRRTSLREQAHSLQRQVASAQRHVHIRQQQAQAAQALLERIRPLQREQLISALQVQQHESAAMEARAQLELQQQDLLRLQTELARIREQLTLLPGESDARSVQLQRERSRIRQQAARNRIEGDAVVRAPAAGRLSGLLASTGQAVQAGQPLLSLVPADAPLEVELWLPVDAAGMVRAGTAVALRFDAFPYARYGIRRGTVRAVSASPIAADQVRAHGGGTDATAAYRLRVRLLPAPNAAPLPLQPGMQVKADLLLERRRLYRLIVDPLRRPSA
ncbi:MAG: hypothetical protein DI635_02120 [Pseudoxanthomonas suwonensis]|nr:MAG: hypothetical protein DI635_02120 [Pseudoxanthomonas suwonensis]